jgi:hypothetical protein
LNHFEGFERNCEKPDEGDVARGSKGKAGEGTEDEECVKGSWGLDALVDGGPRRGAMSFFSNGLVMGVKKGVFLMSFAKRTGTEPGGREGRL